MQKNVKIGNASIKRASQAYVARSTWAKAIARSKRWRNSHTNQRNEEHSWRINKNALEWVCSKHDEIECIVW